MTTNSKTNERTRDVKMASGAQGHLSTVPSVTVLGQPYTPTQLVQHIDDRVALLDACTAERAALAKAVAAEKADRAAFHAFYTALRFLVLAMFQNDPTVLADFGVTGRKTSKVKTKTRMGAIAQGVATRKARNTMSKKAKAKIKGVVPAPAPSPEPAPTPAPAPAPAAAGSTSSSRPAIHS